MVLSAAGELSGRHAPGFSLPDIKFHQHDPQDYRGKVLLVEIMQTTCPNCAAFSSILEEVTAKYGDRVAVLSIVNPPDTQDSVRKYIAQKKITVPILFDCGQASASYLQITPDRPSFHIPHVFLIDPDGMIRNDFSFGPTTTDIFQGRGLFKEIERMLASYSQKSKVQPLLK